MAEPIRLAAVNDGEEQRLPRNVEAEAAFLGALMIDNRIVEDVSIKLRPEHFFEPLHGRIFEQILRLIDRNMLVTPVTLMVAPSSFRMVPMAVASAMVAPLAPDRTRVKASLASTIASPRTGTLTTFTVSPAAKVRVPVVVV